MGIKIYNPTTPGRRQTSVSTFEEITKGKPEKKLIKIKKRTGGRNFYGKITVRHRGGGAKQFYRLIDYKQDKFDLAGKVEAIEYDPNRQARIALVQYEDGEKRYIIAPTELKVGETVLCSKNPIEIKVGNRLPIEHIPLGILIYNIEITPGKGGQLVRTAGGAAKLMAIEGDYATIKSENVLVQVTLKILWINAMVCTIQPSFEIAKDTMNVWRELMCILGRAENQRHMFIISKCRFGVSSPSICADIRAFLNVL